MASWDGGFFKGFRGTNESLKEVESDKTQKEHSYRFL
jgi:hypothetical protein